MSLKQTIGWVLWVGLLGQCIALLKIAYVDGTPIGTTMFMDWQWEEMTMLRVERGAAWILLGFVTLLAVWRSVFAALPITIWFFLIAVATYHQGGSFGAAYAPFAHAARYCLPLLLVFFSNSQNHMETAARWVIGVTFFAHGIEAWMLHPRFVDYIIAAFDNVLAMRVTQTHAEWMLRLIGVVDCGIAILVVVKRWKWVVAWMAFWGAATASSRMIHLGFPKWPATFLRMAHVVIPMALYLWWRRDNLDSEDKVEP